MGSFSVARRDRILTGPVITVDDLVVTAPDGTTHHRQVVGHPGAVSVVALTERDEVVMVRQYRAALDAPLLEIPAGKRDLEGEPPERTAVRELAEEVGLSAEVLVPLAEFHNSPGFSNEHSIVYLALGLREVPHERQGVEEVHLDIVLVPFSEVVTLIRSGEIRDAKSIIGLMMAREYLLAGGDGPVRGDRTG